MKFLDENAAPDADERSKPAAEERRKAARAAQASGWARRKRIQAAQAAREAMMAKAAAVPASVLSPTNAARPEERDERFGELDRLISDDARRARLEDPTR